MKTSEQKRSQHELSVTELEAEQVTALGERQALSMFNINTTTIVAVNVPIALNVLSNQSSATAVGGQVITVGQHWTPASVAGSTWM